jgi:hypothetical protein
MKDTERPIEPAGTVPSPMQDSTSRRITLALLDEYSAQQEGKGYDPYNAHAGGTADFWGHRRKRR